MDSILTDYKLCVICGRNAECEHHLIPGIGTRRICEQDGLKVPMCNMDHNMNGKDSIHGNNVAERMGRIAGQLAWEKEYIRKWAIENGYDGNEREAFRKRYGKSYL